MGRKNKKARWAIALFFIIILFELIGEASVELLGNPVLVYLTKPLMMPLLAVYLIVSVQSSGLDRFLKFVLAALFFSWLGDLFLMVTWTGENLFLFGLGAFLIAHLMYINAFRMIGAGRSFLYRCPWAVIPVVLYIIGLTYGLYSYGSPEFTEMQFPVILYAGVIMVMVLAALNRMDHVPSTGFYLVFIGALLFMFSDSLIAVNKFTNTFVDQPILIRILIMSTYAFGQYMIVEGCLWGYKRTDEQVSQPVGP